jgi:hypothetical protein
MSNQRFLAATIMVVSTVLTLAALELFFRMLPVSDSLMTLPVNSQNPILRFQENRDITWSHGYNFSIIAKKHVNNYGFLNDQDYSPQVKSPLLAVVGDSYVEAVQVENKFTMHGLLAKKAIDAGRVYSFGSSGSPLSNYLAYAEYAKEEFDIDAFVFVIVGNDFDESLQKYSNALGMYQFSDTSEGSSLVLRTYEPSLIKKISRRSALIRYLKLNLKINWRDIESLFRDDKNNDEASYVGNTRAEFDKERILDSEWVVDRFLEQLPILTELSTQEVLFVVDGIRPHLYDPRLLMQARGSYFDHMREYFINAANSLGYEVIDMQPIFSGAYESEGIRFEFATDGHWNETGHALVAESIGDSKLFISLFRN